MRFQMVLTASIHPNGMFVKLSDSQERERQYLRAVRAILDVADPIVEGITFLENTGADLTRFHELVARHNPYGKKVEFISLNLNEYPREFGVGYGEFRLLDAGIAASRILSPRHYIVKLTGRLAVKNLATILRHLPAQFDLAADLRVGRNPSHGWCESRLIVFSYNFYQRRVVGTYKQVNGSLDVTAEHCLYQLIRHSPGARIVTRLPREPVWVGSSGSTGKAYDSFSMRLRHPARVMWRAALRFLNVPDVRAIWASAGTSPVTSETLNSSAAAAN